MTVSVCMATYNGARYIREQLESILPQLGPDDEVVIVDDASSDDTLDIVGSIDSPQITVHRNTENRGYVRSFERAMTLARGEVLLLSDQDDVWVPGRVDALCAATASHWIAASNLILLDSDAPLPSPLTGRPWLLRARDSHQGLRNELRILLGDAPYFGCAMAVRRDALPLVLPFPSYLTESHDLWMATAANAAGEMIHVEQPTVRRRVHDDNASTSRPRGVRAALRSRVLLARLWREARKRAKRADRTA
ncbi:glycosyltransferase family 2 protein [Microbacterium phyllosphaerae]|uniref:glycosyltransferase family 2 protein n=1 Tax=Microbacterium phyllosphaerae TaxID=124798 RepID=UPI00244779F6|nr:glycosyltransferase family 2 protein [Microbacterium phyllosphaerae]